MRAQLRAACWDWDIQIGRKRDSVQLSPQLAGLPSPHTGTLGRPCSFPYHRHRGQGHSPPATAPMSSSGPAAQHHLSRQSSRGSGRYKLQIQKLDTNRPNKLPASCIIVRLYSMPSQDTCRDVLPDRPDRLGSNR